MEVIGRVESLWRYPVKSMRGEEINEAFAAFSGFYGDRTHAFRTAATAGLPFFTGRAQEQMIRYRPRYRRAERVLLPPNPREAEATGPGASPSHPERADLMVDVETPSGDVLAIDDPRLIELLREGLRDGVELSLLRSERALTDCRPVSLISIQTAAQLSRELGFEIDKRRFRANVFADLGGPSGFGENAWVGHRLRIGGKTELAVTEGDTRCKMITLDPDTARASPELLRSVAREHDGTAGVYGVVLVEGTIRAGDDIALLD